MDFSIGGTNLLDFVDFDGEMVEVDWGWTCFFLHPKNIEAFKVYIYIYILIWQRLKKIPAPPKFPGDLEFRVINYDQPCPPATPPLIWWGQLRIHNGILFTQSSFEPVRLQLVEGIIGNGTGTCVDGGLSGQKWWSINLLKFSCAR